MYIAIKYPPRTRDLTKSLFIGLVEDLVIDFNEVPVRLNQRNKNYTRKLVDAFVQIGQFNQDLFVVNKASPKSKMVESQTFGSKYRPYTEMCLTDAYHQHLSKNRQEILRNRKESLKETGEDPRRLLELALLEYFSKHSYRVNGVEQKCSVSVGENGRIVLSPMTNMMRSSVFTVGVDAENSILNLSFELNKLDWSIDGNTDLVIVDYTACKPTVVSHLAGLTFSGDYPVIEGMDRAVVKKMCSSVSNGSTHGKPITRPKQVDGVHKNHSCSLSNKEVLDLIYKAIPAYSGDPVEINKGYYEVETSLMKSILRFARDKGIGLIPLHDGIICSNKHASAIADEMRYLGSKYSLSVGAIESIHGKSRIKTRITHK